MESVTTKRFNRYEIFTLIYKRPRMEWYNKPKYKNEQNITDTIHENDEIDQTVDV